MERFERVLPGCTDRMLRLAEEQSKHRQRIENKFLATNAASEILGVILAGLVVLGGIGGAVFLAYHDKNVGALVSGFGPLAVVGGIFLKTRRSQASEVEAKRARGARAKP